VMTLASTSSRPCSRRHPLEQRGDLRLLRVIDAHGDTVAAGGRNQLSRLFDGFGPPLRGARRGTGLGPARSPGAVHGRGGFTEHARDAAAGAARRAGKRPPVQSALAPSLPPRAHLRAGGRTMTP
jgi:hypothetical protein